MSQNQKIINRFMPPREVEWRSDYIRREEIYKNRNDKVYIFGDNIQEKGGGGMAGEMRGEINTVGIPTKKTPTMKDDAFFTDNEFSYNIYFIFKAFLKIPKQRDLVVPRNIGKGLSKLDTKAPRTYKYLTNLLSSLVDGRFSWIDDLSNTKEGLAIYAIHSYLLNNRVLPNIDALIPKIR